MTDHVQISLILPAYNERASIGATLKDIAGYFQSRCMTYEIIVAADGDDGTRELVTEMRRTNPCLVVIGNVERGGKGRGIREAVAIARGQIIGYADADNKVDIREFEKIQPFLTEGYDLVFGSRALSQSVVEQVQPWFRRIGGEAFGVFMQAVVGLPGIHDTQCGFKFFTGDAAHRIFEAQIIDGYMFDVEILSLAREMGLKMKEVPIRWHDDGDSRLNLVVGNLRNARDIFRIRASKNRLKNLPEVAKARAQSIGD